MKHAVHILGSVQEMAVADIRAQIGEERYAAVKALDAHPAFVVLEVGEEGVSTGTIEGEGNVAKVWSAERMQELAQALHPEQALSGADVYEGHSDEARAPRPAVGKVLAGYAQTIDGKVKAFAIAYLYFPDNGVRQRVQDGTLDTCSIEAELEFERDSAGAWAVEKVLELTGIALANSKDAAPGFPTATILATVQELAQGRKRSGPADHIAVVQEIRDKLAAHGLTADQVFKYEEMLAAPVVRDAVRAEVQELEERLRSEYDAKLSEAQKEAKALAADNAKMVKELAPIREVQRRQELRVDSTVGAVGQRTQGGGPLPSGAAGRRSGPVGRQDCQAEAFPSGRSD